MRRAVATTGELQPETPTSHELLTLPTPTPEMLIADVNQDQTQTVLTAAEQPPSAPRALHSET